MRDTRVSGYRDVEILGSQEEGTARTGMWGNVDHSGIETTSPALAPSPGC